MTNDVAGRRWLVVGASSGIGHALTAAAVAEGARVAAAARRADAIPDGAVALKYDVSDAGACSALVADAVEQLGGLDALVYAAGTSPLVSLADADATTWQTVLATNVIGAALVTRAALPHLVAARGRAVYLSSTSVGRPWPALSVYATSKAALEELVRGWRTEHPEIGVTRVAVGPTLTAFADAWDAELLGDAMDRWAREAYLPAGVMTAEYVAAEILRVLTSPVRIEDLRLVADPG